MENFLRLLPNYNDSKVNLFTSLACRCCPWHGSEMNLGTEQPGCEVMRTMALPSPLGSDTRINAAPCDTEGCAATVDSVNDFFRSNPSHSFTFTRVKKKNLQLCENHFISSYVFRSNS